MTKKLIFMSLLVCLALVFTACGGKKGEEQAAEQPAAETPQESEGIAVAKEILGTFDQVTTEAVALVKNKPEAAVVLPQLEELFAKYRVKMEEINTRYLALRDKDIVLFGDANGYLGENRGKHVIDQKMALDEYIVYYNIEKEQKEVGEFLSKKFVELLEIATKR